LRVQAARFGGFLFLTGSIEHYILRLV